MSGHTEAPMQVSVDSTTHGQHWYVRKDIADDLLAALRDAEKSQDAMHEIMLSEFNSGRYGSIGLIEAKRLIGLSEENLQATRAAIAKAEGRDVSGGVG